VIDVAILGPLEVRVDGRAVELPRAKNRALLAVLAQHPGEALSTDRLIDAVWGDDPPESAANALQVYVSQLRKALGAGVVVRRPPGYALGVEPEAVDLVRFERLVAQARPAPPSRAAELLREALALWRGDPEADAPRLQELRLAAVEDRIDADLALGRHADLVSELEVLVAEEPLRERPRAQLMLALYRCGRQADALDLYRRTREVLVEELGIDPSPELQQLERAVLAQDPQLAAPASPARSSLPAPPTPIVGRARELEQARTLLAAGTRLLTLTGPGGIGKTRLALEIAREAAPRHRDGAHFAALASIADPSLLPPRLLQALGASPDADLAAELRERELLLVLDNFEQLTEAAPLLTELLAVAPGLTLLVTSQRLLRVAGEHELPVPPLDAAVDLFRERAAAVAPDVDLAAHADAVAAICVRLDGLPLAIELAAARTRLLPPPALLARLESRLALLTGGARDAPERQRTMRAAVDWTYRLLEPDEQLLFSRLGVFVDGASLSAVEEVCGDVATLDALAALVDASLLRQRGDAEPRFGMLGTLREYALEQLAASGEEELLRRRHARFFLRFARELEPGLEGPDQAELLERLELEHANLRAALAAAAASGDGETAVGLAAALRRFWHVRGHVDEGLRALESVADAFPDAPAADRAKVLNGAGIVLGERGDYAAARARFEQALEAARGVGDPSRVARALSNLGNISLQEGDLGRAHELYTESLELAEREGDVIGLALSLENVGLVELARGERDRAIATFERGLAAAEAGRAPHEAASVAIPLARALLDGDELDRARALLAAALATLQEQGDRHKSAECMEAFAAVAVRVGRAGDAAALLEAADAERAAIGAVRHLDQRDWYEATLSRVRDAVGPDTWELEAARGSALGAAGAVALCLELADARAPVSE
jgi:predicted ATPase/DNA-binding SARP family transcriptional activator